MNGETPKISLSRSSKDSKNYRNFMKAFVRLVNDSGHGTMTKVAKATGKTPQWLSAAKKSFKKAMSPPLQEAIADFFGYSIEEMVAMGRDIGKKKGSEPFPGYLSLLRLHDKKKIAVEVIRIVSEKYGMSGMLMHAGDEILKMSADSLPPFIRKYYAGEISLTGLYEQACEHFAAIKTQLESDISDAEERVKRQWYRSTN